MNGILYSQPKIPSEVVSIVDGLLRNPGVGLIVIDSVGSMSSDSEVDKAMEDIHMNQNALFLNRAMRKWQAAMNGGVSEDLESPTTLLVINQSYQTLGTYSVDVAQGGRGLRHGKGLSLKTRIKEKVYNNTSRDAVLGVHVAVENLKNKTGMPYRKAEYYLNLNDNDPELGYCEVDMANQILDLGLELGLVTQRGAWTFYTTTDGVEMKWNGKAAMLKDLRDMPDVQQTVLKGIYATLRPEEESE